MTAKLETVPKAPTPAQVDALVKKYSDAKENSDAAKAAASVMSAVTEEAKAELVMVVESFGFRHTEKSKRLNGLHSIATTTTGTRTTIDDAAVETFREYLAKKELVELSGRFFVAHTTYSLVEGPSQVLMTLSLGKKMREKIDSLIHLCFKIMTNAPSLKVETVAALKP